MEMHSGGSCGLTRSLLQNSSLEDQSEHLQQTGKSCRCRRSQKHLGREGGGTRTKVTGVKKGCRCERNNRETQK